MPGYLNKIKTMKESGQLDSVPEGTLDANGGVYEINELNELSPTACGDSQNLPAIQSPTIEFEIRRRIARLQTGQTWLLDHHQRWQTGDLTAASDAEFSRVWNRWWKMDERLRTDYGFQGCVFGPDGSCPDGFPCLGCSALPAPAVVAQLVLGSN